MRGASHGAIPYSWRWAARPGAAVKGEVRRVQALAQARRQVMTFSLAGDVGPMALDLEQGIDTGKAM